MKSLIKISNINFQRFAPLIAKIAEYKGKEKLYYTTKPEILRQLLENAIIQSVESSNRIEGIDIGPGGVKRLLNSKDRPSNRPEEQINGYKDVLDILHKNGAETAFETRFILQFHKILKADSNPGRWKIADNQITKTKGESEVLLFSPPPPHQTPILM
ncbi:MAG: hypothetical protein GY786_09720, partial [Proteobacteria bacterium]|nr:hypothetical protein [Pseudomonadota bacterium]